MKDLDLLCIGEALVDFLPAERGTLRQVRHFAVASGGAPANVAVGAARLGARVGFCGAVGDDEFGHFLRDALVEEGVDCTGLRHTDTGKTGLSFIALDERGERSFDFYGAPSADMLFGSEEVRPDLLRRAAIVHVGSNTLLLPAGVEATRACVELGREVGALISVDPNLRLHRWKDRALLRRLLDRQLQGADVVKIAADEAAFVTDEAEPRAAASALVARGVGLAVVTRGAGGAVWARSTDAGEVPAPQVEAVDATGAGDGFMAALLVRLAAAQAAGTGPRQLQPEALREHLVFACRVGAAVVQHLGAVAGLPRAGEPLP